MNEAKEIWRRCFQDSPEEIDFFWQHFYKEEHWKKYMKDGRTLSSLHRHDYPLRFGFQEQSFPFLVGVATLPEDRGLGGMTHLLFHELQDLREEGRSFCFLHPVNPSIYRGFGFEYYSRLEEYSLPIELLSQKERGEGLEMQVASKEDLATLAKIHSLAQLRQFSCHARTEEGFAIFLDEIHLAGGETYLVTDRGRGIGYLALYKEGEELFVRECLATNPKGYEMLLFFLKSFRTDFKRLRICMPEGSHLEAFLGGETEIHKKFSPYAMGRILNPKAFLEDLGLKAPGISFFVKDPVLIENAGYYRIGEEISFQREEPAAYDFSIDIRDLCSLCFGYYSFEDCLQLGKLRLFSTEHLEDCKKLFPKKLNSFYEFW